MTDQKLENLLALKKKTASSRNPEAAERISQRDNVRKIAHILKEAI